MEVNDRRDLLITSVMSDPRRRILASLFDEKKNISELARELEKDRSTIAYHLDILERAKLVSGSYEQIEEHHSPGRFGHYFHVNRDMLLQALELARNALTLPEE